MPEVRCLFPGCDYITENLDNATVVALITSHNETHTSGQATLGTQNRPPVAQTSARNEGKQISPCQEDTISRETIKMQEVRCLFPGCDYKTENLDNAIVVALITSHNETHTSGQATLGTQKRPPVAQTSARNEGRTNFTLPRNEEEDNKDRRTNRKTCPKICFSYNGRGCEKTGSCPYLHMCKNYVEGRCESGRECSKSHNLLDAGVKDMLEKHGIDTRRRPKEILADLIDTFKAEESRRKVNVQGASADGNSKDKSSKRTAVKLCFNYNGRGCEKTGSCPYLHMCMNYVEGGCPSGRGCSKSHNVLDAEVKDLLEKHGIDTRRKPREILTDLKESFKDKDSKRKEKENKSTDGNSNGQSLKRTPIQLCFKYNGSGCEKTGSCPYLHMCKNYLEGGCPSGRACSKSHDVLDAGVKEMLEKRGIDTKRRPREIRGDLKETLKNEKITRKKICYFNLRGKCRWNVCLNVHCELPYQWKYKRLAEKEWNVPDEQENEQIEHAFCDPATQMFKHKTKQGVTIHIDFDDMIGIDENDQNIVIRRISTPSSVEFTRQPWATVWIWYWKNESGTWIKYREKDDSCRTRNASINDIEQAYISNTDGELKCCEKGYIIDFAKMMEVDIEHNTEVRVRRRPTFVSAIEAKEKKKQKPPGRKPEQKSQQGPSNDDLFAPPPNWNMSHGEDITDHCQLIMLQESDTEYKEIKTFFQESIASTVRIKSIERIENGDLWENFISKRAKMLKKKSKEEVGERRLFHGTQNQYIDPIWHQGFDFRLSGQTSGTAYGKGSYFATTSSYSNCYVEQGVDRAMFVVKVLPGSYVLGQSDYKRPPHKDKDNPCSELYDSCVNNERYPSIFIIFDNNQIYPEYLIKYN